jgi:menaquinone-specific isochorismate synthase
MTQLRASQSAETEARPQESVRRQLELAQARAQGGPDEMILIRMDAPLVAPEALLQRFPDRDCVLWNPPGGPHFAGIDVAHSITGNASMRFAEVMREGAKLWARIGTAPAAHEAWHAPRLFGGFAFSADGATSDAWSDFGAARFVLPRVTYARSQDHAFLTLALERAELDRWLSSESVQLFQRVYETLLGNPRPAPSQAVQPVSRQEPDAVDFYARVEDLVRRIGRGELQKVVAAREVQLAFVSALDAVATVIALREQAPECLRFLFRWGAASFVGATPERLLHKRGRWLETEALAGSIDAGAESPEHSLKANPKELEEHELVVAAIRHVLEPVTDSLTLPCRPEVRSLKHILHLCTPIQARLDTDLHVLELLERLHPTPAVGGVPTGAALDWIGKYEPFDRGWYSGAVGWFDAAGDGDFNVALRSGLVRANQAWLYAGAGIVRESAAAAEYAETTLKLAAVLTSLRARP